MKYTRHNSCFGSISIGVWTQGLAPFEPYPQPHKICSYWAKIRGSRHNFLHVEQKFWQENFLLSVILFYMRRCYIIIGTQIISFFL
jgi:hypothetical protein